MKRLNDRLTSVYAHLQARWACWWRQGEAGIENVEWVALAAVILVFLIAMMLVLKPGGQTIASIIIDNITQWLKKWTEGL